jgi:hypothetical protein
MTIGTLQIDGQKFRVVPEAEYKLLRAAARKQEQEAKLDASDLAEAKPRVKDPRRKAVALSRLKEEPGL